MYMLEITLEITRKC